MSWAELAQSGTFWQGVAAGGTFMFLLALVFLAIAGESE